MPELPEVETIRRQLDPALANAEITGADSHWSDKFNPALDAVGSTILGVRRRGKYLIFDLHDDHELIAHLGMTGSFHVIEAAEPHEPNLDDHGAYARAVWSFADGRELLFNDTRRFGRLRVVSAGDYRDIPTLRQMGPEPLGEDFTGASLHAATKASSRAIKTQLLSQRPVSGVGNIYADEALFLARIDPRARRVGRERCDRLAQTIKDVLATGIDNGGTTLRDYVNVDGDAGENQHSLLAYGRGGEPCVTCGDPLSSCVLDARTTTFCRNCQKR
ncbi:MAG: formamidopyrimidine-DNA glycosylase [Verrucomicrobiales bacterium]|jgi:formamidopyrimidine-DNA glycosylase